MTQQEQTAARPEANTKPARLPEPWLRGTRAGISIVERAVLHSLELTREDLDKWCGGLDNQQLNARPFNLPSIAFQLRHISRSLDRFLTYAEGQALSADQLAALSAESETPVDKDEVWRELTASLDTAEKRLLKNLGWSLETPLKIGRKGLPTTIGGLLVHMAEHTQRHVGQAVTTSKIVNAQPR